MLTEKTIEVACTFNNINLINGTVCKKSGFKGERGKKRKSAIL